MLQYTHYIRNICYFAAVQSKREPFLWSSWWVQLISYYCPLLGTGTTELHPGVNLHTVELSVHRVESLRHNQQFRQSLHQCMCQLPVNVILVMPQLSLAREPMCVLVRKSQVGMLLTAWWMFMAVISLGALQKRKVTKLKFSLPGTSLVGFWIFYDCEAEYSALNDISIFSAPLFLHQNTVSTLQNLLMFNQGI